MELADEYAKLYLSDKEDDIARFDAICEVARSFDSSEMACFCLHIVSWVTTSNKANLALGTLVSKLNKESEGSEP